MADQNPHVTGHTFPETRRVLLPVYFSNVENVD